MHKLPLSGLILASALTAFLPAWAEPPGTATATTSERSIAEWLLRMHEASRRRAYVGTLVVSAGGNMSSSRVWHVCDGTQQMERVDALTGAPRSTFRRNDEVVTFSPQTRVAVAERRESLGLFPHLLKSTDASIDQYYSASALGSERVAGFEADVVQLQPRDKLRFGYRIWSEKRSGLVLKMQTLDEQTKVLEQVAFSELQLDAPVSMDKLSRMMANTEGYKVVSPELVKTTAAAEGWRLVQDVPGFRPMSCLRRPSTSGPDALQWVFSDGLASVSLFIEPFDPRRHLQEGLQGMGATYALTRRLVARGGPWWLTLVGEVPPQTLQAFAQALERTP
jgi:sigma-E factor negative regulatory protein RseB